MLKGPTDHSWSRQENFRTSPKCYRDDAKCVINWILKGPPLVYNGFLSAPDSNFRIPFIHKFGGHLFGDFVFLHFFSRFIRFRFIGDTFFRFINWGKIRSFCSKPSSSLSFAVLMFGGSFLSYYSVRLNRCESIILWAMLLNFWARTLYSFHPPAHWVHQLWKMMLSFVTSSKISTSSSAKLHLPRGPLGNKLAWAKASRTLRFFIHRCAGLLGGEKKVQEAPELERKCVG